jgi:hypothetical protein
VSEFRLLERSHSGLVHQSRKLEYLYGYRGFKSHPLRHLILDFELCIWKGARAVELAALEML